MRKTAFDRYVKERASKSKIFLMAFVIRKLEIKIVDTIARWLKLESK